MLPWPCASHLGLQRKWEFQSPSSWNTWLLQDNCFIGAQLYQIRCLGCYFMTCFLIHGINYPAFKVPSEHTMLNGLLSRFSANETLYVQKESCWVWWHRPVIPACGRWRQNNISSSLPLVTRNLKPAWDTGRSVSKVQNVKRNETKIIPKGYYLFIFLNLGSSWQKVPGARLYVRVGSLLPMTVTHVAIPRPAGDYSKTGFSLASIVTSQMKLES